jgi:hypothetical protein
MASHPRNVQPSDMVVSQGLKEAGIDIDVFLEPLMEDMAKL